ncbi:hypothetical protein C5167_044169 [Papaver somniferum]|uniref:Fanconi Anaemia group E protein C-terminal domain-containing protein n=1 Tax=Papaver somniferum TaxID=3469 RepID=A0A4Y7L8Q5_PAPSO|nr:uncharacterized protein LOC113315054 [Papaver somniferum]RZC81596.1 hypothetical protein C5167_044169 [Papaver somniferum]
MEAWVPLFDIFLNSPSPEFDASLWFSSNSLTNSTTTTSTNSFLKLLSKPIDTISTNPSSSIQSKRFLYIQTLPDAVQSRILSFLTTESKRFCKRELCLLAENVLNGSEEVDFWVKKSAHNLLDKMSDSGFRQFSTLNLNGLEEEEEFFALPSCLQSCSHSKSSVLPWLPLTFDELRESASVSCIADEGSDEAMEVEELCEVEENGEVLNQVDVSIDSEVRTKAGSLKMKLLECESAKRTENLANEIRQLCFEADGKEVRNSFGVLGLIEPWEVDDETASILITNLLGVNANESELSWASKVLCSIILPKLLVLNEPASRVLVTTTIESCKPRQKAAVDALLFPLVLCKEGLNTHLCDVMSRIIKECLHPAHVSAFCQRLLCGEEESRKFICLPCHQHLVSDKLVWTEPLFMLFQNILNQNVSLTQDSIEHLVSVVRELAGKYSESLKFSTFLLCLVTKCHSSLKHHKLILIPTVELTNTFMTKSILSKLNSL